MKCITGNLMNLGISFKIYYVTIFLYESLILLVVLTVLNIYSVQKFRKIIRSREFIRNEYKTYELNFTKTVLILNFISIITRELDLICGVARRIEFFGMIEITYKTKEFIIFLQFMYCKNYANELCRIYAIRDHTFF